MRRCCLLFAIALPVAVLAGAPVADLWRWNDSVRPPVSLRQALDIAEKLLGDDAENRYCVDVSIYGNPEGSPKPGAWNLYFAAKDGSKKHVYVGMDGNAELSTWNEAIDWTKSAGRPQGLEDIQTRLAALFAKEHLDVKLERTGQVLKGSYRTREYQIYKTKDDGSFANELSQVVGPEHDGFLLDAELVNELTHFPHYGNSAYWIERTRAFPTATENRFVVVRTCYGRAFKREIQWQIDDAFGDYVHP